jgi:hypothetical protein
MNLGQLVSNCTTTPPVGALAFANPVGDTQRLLNDRRRRRHGRRSNRGAGRRAEAGEEGEEVKRRPRGLRARLGMSTIWARHESNATQFRGGVGSMPKATVYGPVVFSLIGGLVGISVAMLFLNDSHARAHVYLDNSLPPFFCGLIVGCMVGVMMMKAYEDRPRTRGAIEVAAFALLCSAIAAPFGWIVGELRFPRISEKGMAVAAAGGLAFGLIVGAVRRHRPEPESTQS